MRHREALQQQNSIVVKKSGIMTTKESIVVFGAGGHAKVVADAIRAQGKYLITAVVDPGKAETSFCGLTVRDNELSLTPTNFIVAVGNNQLRKELFNQLRATGWRPASIIHPTAIVAAGATISSGTVIVAGSIINPEASIGQNCIINTGATIDHDCVIGDHAHVAPGCNVAGNVTLEEGVFLGIGSRVIDSISIGAWSTVGSGGAVIGDVPSQTTVVGVPARPVRSQSDRLSAGVS
jgi:sugar O-acyltransferase (sialic acid O-acetyltransferase NeuD family)